MKPFSKISLQDFRSLAAIALREIWERRTTYAASAALGMLPLLLLAFDGFGLAPGKDIAGLSAGIIFAALTGGVALMGGASIIGRELTQKRLAFYFARPVSGFSIWGGKFIGGLLLTLTAPLLSILPTILILGDLRNANVGWAPFTILGIGATLLFSFGLVAGVMFGSKSKWLLLDLALMPVMFLVAFPAIERLVYSGVQRFELINGTLTKSNVEYAAFIFGALCVIGIMLVASLPASAISLVMGRTDIRRVHRVLSTSLWTLVFTGLLLFHGYSFWFVSASPKDMTDFYTTNIAPKGSWIAVNGSVRNRGAYYRPSFLLDTSSNNYIRFERPFYSLRFSGDGRSAAWLEFEGLSEDSAVKVVVMNLADQTLKPVRTKLSFPGDSRPNIYLSSDGSRMAAIREKLISVFELPSGKELSTVALPLAPQGYKRYFWGESAIFIGNDRVRFCLNLNSESNATKMSIMEFDAAAEKLETLGTFEQPASPYSSFAIAFGDRLVIRSKKSILIYDAKNGSKTAEIVSVNEWPAVTTLADGRIVLGEMSEKKAQLRVFSPEGVEQKTIALGNATGFVLGAEISQGKIVLSLTTTGESFSYKGSKIFTVDLNTETITQKGEGMAPLVGRSWLDEPAGLEASKLFYDGKSLVRYDLESGEKRTVVTMNK